MIPEEGNSTYPQFPKCNMFPPHTALNRWHLATDFSCLVEEGKRRRLAEEEARVETTSAINAYRIQLDLINYFKYLGRVLLASDDN